MSSNQFQSFCNSSIQDWHPVGVGQTVTNGFHLLACKGTKCLEHLFKWIQEMLVCLLLGKYYCSSSFPFYLMRQPGEATHGVTSITFRSMERDGGFDLLPYSSLAG